MAYQYAGQYGSEAVIDSSGTPMPSQAVSVVNRGGSTLQTLYTSRLKAATAANPTTTDSRGNLLFYADPGPYDLLIGALRIPVEVPIDAEEAAQDIDVDFTSGLDSALPAVDGSTGWYYATDTHRMFRSDGAAWTQVTPGGELGYAQITANQNSTSTTGEDVTGLSVTVSVRSRPILVEAFATVQSTLADRFVGFYLMEGATLLVTAFTTIPKANGYGFVRPAVRLVPSTGSHTYKCQVVVESATTGTVVASSGNPAYLRVVEA